MTKHTPGPWRLHYVTGSKGRARGKQILDAIVPDGIGKGTIVHPNWNHDYDGQVWEAWLSVSESNARLIAAAPELLELLEEAALWINDEDETSGKLLAAKVAAAIAKVKGED